MMKEKNNYTQRIINFLEKNFPTEYSPWAMHNNKELSDIPYPTLRTILSRLAKAKMIFNDHRGYYRAIVDKDSISRIENPDIQFHGIKIECNLDKEISTEKVASYFLVQPETCDKHKSTYPFWFTSSDYTPHKVTITIHNMGLIEIFLSATKHPLDPADFLSFLSYIDGILHTLGTNLWKANTRVRQYEISIDFKKIRLDNVSIRLQDFVGLTIQMYNKKEDKKEGMRAEYQEKNTTLSAYEAFELLKYMATKELPDVVSFSWKDAVLNQKLVKVPTKNGFINLIIVGGDT